MSHLGSGAFKSQPMQMVQAKKDIFVGGIAHGTSDIDLKELFSEVGRVVEVRQVRDRDTGVAKGFAFIEFEDAASCESAIRNLNGRELNGRTLGVNYSKKSSVQSQISVQESVSPPPPSIPKTISDVLDSMSLREMYEIMANMKKFVEDEPEKARLMLISYPNVTEALLEMQVKLGMSSQEETMKLNIQSLSENKTAQQNLLSIPQENGQMEPPNMPFQNNIMTSAIPNLAPIVQNIQPFQQNAAFQVPPQQVLFHGHQVLNPPPPSFCPNNVMLNHQNLTQSFFYPQGELHHQQVGIPGVGRVLQNNIQQPPMGMVPPEVLNQVMNMTPQHLATLPPDKQQQIMDLQNKIRLGQLQYNIPQQSHQQY